jgi:hypothetical protein
MMMKITLIVGMKCHRSTAGDHERREEGRTGYWGEEARSTLIYMKSAQ